MVGFSEAQRTQTSVPQARVVVGTGQRSAVEHHGFVDFVAQNHHMFRNARCELCPVLVGPHHARWIVRGVHHNHCGARGHSGGQGIPIDAGTLWGNFKRNRYGYRTRHHHRGMVGIVGGFEQNDFVSRSAQSLDGRKDPHGRPRNHSDFMLGVVGRSVSPQLVGRDRFAQP